MDSRFTRFTTICWGAILGMEVHNLADELTTRRTGDAAMTGAILIVLVAIVAYRIFAPVWQPLGDSSDSGSRAKR